MIDMEAITALDLVLAPGVLILAGVLLNIRDLFASIVSFIIFGLLMAATWARLDAVDIALAEAALGAGITGALLLNALRDVGTGAGDDAGRARGSSHRTAGVPAKRSLLSALLVMPVAVILGHAVISAPIEHEGLGPRAWAAMGDSGVEHDVTAVLLAFRAYDTLLELGVLFLAVVGAWALRLPQASQRPPALGVVLLSAERLLVPVAILIGGYLLWRGSDGPGGAFQGGAVLAGAAVLLHLGFRTGWPRVLEPLVGLGLGLGILVFGTIGLVATLVGRPFLFYRGTWAQLLIPTIETAATVSVAVALVAVFIGRAYWEPGEEP